MLFDIPRLGSASCFTHVCTHTMPGRLSLSLTKQRLNAHMFFCMYTHTQFCCPQGWHLTHNPQPPWFIDFILTAENGSRLFCSCLNFHQVTRLSVHVTWPHTSHTLTSTPMHTTGHKAGDPQLPQCVNGELDRLSCHCQKEKLNEVEKISPGQLPLSVHAVMKTE